LARVEAALGKIDAAVKLMEMIEADEQKSASEARAAKKRYLGRLFEVVMLREKALGDEINEWERSRADQVSRRRAMLGWARRRLEDERTAIEQGSAVHGSKQSTAAEVCQKANAMAAEVEAERLCTGRISFASGGANIAQGGTASGDLVGAILHAGHLHISDTNDTKVRLSSLLALKANLVVSDLGFILRAMRRSTMCKGSWTANQTTAQLRRGKIPRYAAVLRFAGTILTGDSSGSPIGPARHPCPLTQAQALHSRSHGTAAN
jgi:hypothetical protein